MKKTTVGLLLLIAFLAAPIFGQAPKKFIVNPFTGQPDYYNDSSAVATLGAVGDVTFTLTATGDLIHRDAASKWVNLAIGTGGKYLRSTGTLPVWSSLLDADLPAALTGKSYNGMTPTAAATGFSLAGGTTSKTLTVELDSLVNQDLTTDASPTHAGLTLGSVAANGILNLYGLHANGYYSIIKGSNAEGLAGADLRIGLDESNRTLILCERGDIGTDFGLSAQVVPTLALDDGSGSRITTLNCTGLRSNSSAATFILQAPGSLYLRGNEGHCGTNWLNIDSNGGWGLYTSAARQAWLYLEPDVIQSGTSAFDGIYLNVASATYGTGATGDGNNLLNLSVSAVPKFKVDVAGSVTAGQTSVSLADNAVHDTGITAFYGQLIVKDTTTGVTGIFRLDGGATPVIISAHTNFSTTQGTDVKINVYFSTTYKIENCNTAASVVKCAFVGTI